MLGLTIEQRLRFMNQKKRNFRRGNYSWHGRKFIVFRPMDEVVLSIKDKIYYGLRLIARVYCPFPYIQYNYINLLQMTPEAYSF